MEGERPLFHGRKYGRLEYGKVFFRPVVLGFRTENRFFGVLPARRVQLETDGMEIFGKFDCVGPFGQKQIGQKFANPGFACLNRFGLSGIGADELGRMGPFGGTVCVLGEQLPEKFRAVHHVDVRHRTGDGFAVEPEFPSGFEYAFGQNAVLDFGSVFDVLFRLGESFRTASAELFDNRKVIVAFSFLGVVRSKIVGRRLDALAEIDDVNVALRGEHDVANVQVAVEYPLVMEVL